MSLVTDTSVRSEENFRVTRSRRNVVWTGAGALIVVVVLALFPYIVHSGTTAILVQAFIVLTMASMWNLPAGYAGLVSVGQQAFVGRRAQLRSTGRAGENAGVRGGGRGLRRRGCLARDQPAPGAAGRGVQHPVDRGDGVRNHHRRAWHDRGADPRHRGVHGAAADAGLLQRVVPDHPGPGGDLHGPVRTARP